MVSIISGTNRTGSNSAIVSKELLKILTQNQVECDLLNLKDLPEDFAYRNDSISKATEELTDIIEKHVTMASQFIFVIAEYNGSFPGVLKSFIDAIPTEKIKGKNAILIGISAGRTGNLLGMDHFTGVLNYLGVHVHPFKLAIPHVDQIVDSKLGSITDENVIKKIENLLKDL